MVDINHKATAFHLMFIFLRNKKIKSDLFAMNIQSVKNIKSLIT